jgi:hypothetical protein
MLRNYIDWEIGNTSGIIFLLPTLCTDIQENKLNICLAFAAWQLTISLK